MKKNIAVITGGNSSEYVISIQSAEQIISVIDKSKFNVFKIEIKEDKWSYIAENKKIKSVNRSNFTIDIEHQTIHFDLAFILIHGTPGEDGRLQAYFDLLNIPYTTCGVLTSALSFDKYACKTYLSAFEILSPKSVFISSIEEINTKRIIEEVGLPCFVKPNQAGSSFGISKVSKEKDLLPAINKAFKEDKQVLVDEFIDGTEITCGLFISGKNQFVFPVTEISTENDFFDFEAKYTPGITDEITPARISQEDTVKCQELSVKIYNHLNCKGIVRVDYILNEKGMYFLELNTIPGMSENSIVPKQIREHGITISEITNSLITDSLQTH